MYNKVIISTKAGAKIDRLILNQNKEVGFYGTVEYQGQTVIVTDILIYPQTVTGCTVNTDPVKMAEFFMKHRDILTSIRFQGHSHVTMQTSPSSVDTTFYREITATLKPNEVYVFMIFNKHNDTTSYIFQEGKFYKIPMEWEIDNELDYTQIEEYVPPLPTVYKPQPKKTKFFPKKKNKVKPGHVFSSKEYQAEDDWIEELLSRYHKPNQNPQMNPWWNR